MRKTRFIPDGLTTRTPMQFCPSCLTKIDAHSSLTDKDYSPQPDDFTICLNCGALLKFGPKLDLHLSSLMEVPMHSRMDFAKVVQTVKERGLIHGDPGEGQ